MSNTVSEEDIQLLIRNQELYHGTESILSFETMVREAVDFQIPENVRIIALMGHRAWIEYEHNGGRGQYLMTSNSRMSYPPSKLVYSVSDHLTNNQTALFGIFILKNKDGTISGDYFVTSSAIEDYRVLQEERDE